MFARMKNLETKLKSLPDKKKAAEILKSVKEKQKPEVKK